MHRFLLFAVVVLCSACPGFGSQSASSIDDVPTFDVEIQPIFERLCNDCHSPGLTQNGGNYPYRYDVCEDTVVDGVAMIGAKALAPNTLDRFIDGRLGMPPSYYTKTPKPDDAALVKKWIEEGSPCDASEVKSSGTTNNEGTTTGTTSNNGQDDV